MSDDDETLRDFLNELRPKLSGHYRIEGHDVVEEPDLLTWARWFESSMRARIVGRTQVGTYAISTVFLGLDHNWGGGPPILFETMVYGSDGEDRDIVQRYHTYSDASAGHRRWIEHYRHEQGDVIVVFDIPWDDTIDSEHLPEP